MFKKAGIKESINGRLKNLKTEANFEFVILEGLKLNDKFAAEKFTAEQLRNKGKRPWNGQPCGLMTNRTTRPLFAVGIILCLLLLIIPVTVLGIPGFQRLIELLSPNIVNYLQPVMLSSEDEGIKLEVLAAVSDDDNVVVFLTLQDLTSDRLDNTTDLESYYIDKVAGNHSQLLTYDEESRTATFQLTGSGGVALSGKKIGLNLMTILSKKSKNERLKLNLPLDEILDDRTAETITLDSSQTGEGGGTLYHEITGAGTFKALKPDAMNLEIPDLDYAVVSNIGFVDGRLRMQLKWANGNAKGHLFSESKADDSQREDYATYFTFKDDKGQSYSEFVFDLPEEDIKENLDSIVLYGRFVNPEVVLNGNWAVTFEINPMEQKQAECDIDLGFVRLNSVTVSPLGVSVVGTGLEIDFESFNLDKDYISLNIKEYTHDISSVNQNIQTVRLKYLHFTPLSVQKIKYIIINGITIPLE